MDGKSVYKYRDGMDSENGPRFTSSRSASIPHTVFKHVATWSTLYVHKDKPTSFLHNGERTVSLS
jgi:hypothetical protein